MPTKQLKALIRDVPDFPKPGILFKDITPLLRDPAGLALAVELMANPFRGAGITAVAGAESRGFIFGTAVAQALSCGFVPIRKKSKLPPPVKSVTYALEYGTDTLEIRDDAVRAGQRGLQSLRTVQVRLDDFFGRSAISVGVSSQGADAEDGGGASR
jgi:adenine phosphoribosyltransferase